MATLASSLAKCFSQHFEDRDDRNGRKIGRDLYARRAWADAFDALTEASAAAPLDADDAERLAWSAMLSGH